MPRIKEPPIGTTEVPAYKSPNSRIIRSLRAAYDNGREQQKEKSKQILSLRGKLRDTQESRDSWKMQANDVKAKLAKLEKENEDLKNSLKKSNHT